VPGAGLPPVDVAGEEVVRGPEEVGGSLERCDGRVPPLRAGGPTMVRQPAPLPARVAPRRAGGRDDPARSSPGAPRRRRDARRRAVPT